MTGIKICRICLRKGVKLYHSNGFQLKNLYKELFHFEVVEEKHLPKYFCFECAAMLHKFHKFKEKCFTAQNFLRDILKTEKISYEAVSKIDRQSNKLDSQLELMRVTNKVKTITIRNRSTLILKQTKHVTTEDTIKIEESDFQNENECKNIENVILYVSDDKIMEDCLPVKLNSEIKHKTSSEVQHNIDVNNLSLHKEDKFDVENKLNDDSDLDNDDKMLIDDRHEVFSSEDDNLLIDLVKEKKMKVKEEEILEKNSTIIPEVKKSRAVEMKKNNVKAKSMPRNQDKKKKIKLEEEKKTPKSTLDLTNWERRYLTEEEAVNEFKKRSQDPKYMAAAYQCTHCFKGFSKEDMLIRHNKIKHDERLGPHECRFCHSRFKWHCYLKKHMQRHYNLYSCLRCPLTCNLDSTALLHDEHHNGVVKKCEFCGEEYTHTSTYYSHLRSHRSSFVCTLCGQSFVSATGLRYHKNLKHINLSSTKPSEPASTEEDTYCERCDIRFETREAFDLHYLHSDMHSLGTVVAGAVDNPAPTLIKARSRIIRRSPRKPRTCPTCETTFRTQTAFFQHRCAEHRPEAVAQDPILRTPLKGPTGRSYRNAEKHMCEICGLSVAAVYMEQHINTHTHQKAYPCKTCGMKLYAQSSLKRHELTHTGERPYPCPLCDKRFTQSNSMKLHYRTFHLKEPYPKRNRKKKTEDSSMMDFGS